MRGRLVFGGLVLVGLLGAMTGLPALGQGPPPPPPPPPPGGGAPPAGGAGGPLAGLGAGERARFQAGLAAFGRAADVPGGLGPVFNDVSCARCHAGAGASLRVGTRFGRIVNGQFDPMIAFGGPLLQDRGIGRFNRVNFVGEVVPPQATIVARRRTTQLFGLGLVDAVPDSVFMQLAQHEHQTNPATAGRPSPVIDPVTGTGAVGKFGWKAQQPHLFAFAADALVNEMGVTTPVFPNENCPQGNCQSLAANPARTHPNQTTDLTVQQLADFMTFLAPPPPGPSSADAAAGRAIFTAIGCADCHTPTLITGLNLVPALSNVSFSPYSDFLLHDMGSLGDGIVQNQAGGHEMRTAPLWGLRLQPSLLHDGRAHTPADAILAHDGQGRVSRDHFKALSSIQVRQLLAFLNAL